MIFINKSPPVSHRMCQRWAWVIASALSNRWTALDHRQAPWKCRKVERNFKSAGPKWRLEWRTLSLCVCVYVRIDVCVALDRKNRWENERIRSRKRRKKVKNSSCAKTKMWFLVRYMKHVEYLRDEMCRIGWRPLPCRFIEQLWRFAREIPVSIIA